MTEKYVLLFALGYLFVSYQSRTRSHNKPCGLVQNHCTHTCRMSSLKTILQFWCTQTVTIFTPSMVLFTLRTHGE